jgi:hypothetical protein
MTSQGRCAYTSLGPCEAWVPLVPTDQVHDRFRQVGPAHHVVTFLRLVSLFYPTWTLGPPTLSVSQYKAGKAEPLRSSRPKSSTSIQSRTGRRVLLSGGLNQYKLTVSFVFCVFLHNLRVPRPRFHPAEQINHWA